MAKRIRFPLQMKGIEVRTIEELKYNFDLESVLSYFANGKLVTWLKDRYYDNEAMAVEVLSATDAELNQKLMSIFGISVDEEAEEIDMDAIQRRNEKLMLLHQFTDDKAIIDNVDSVAFNQDDLLDILDEGAKTIYLCEGEFDIPLSVKNVTYIGLRNPIVLLRAYDNVNFASLNLKFVDICFGWDISNITSADRLYQAERMIERQEFDTAISLLKQLVVEKNPRAFSVLNVIYEKVYPSVDNKNKASALNKQADALGQAFDWLETGREFPNMIKLLNRLVCKDDKIALKYLGYKYYSDNDFENAIKCWKIGAEKNDMVCCELLSCIYREDYDIISNANNENAIYYGKKGALLGNAEIASQLAVIYDNGELVSQDINEAFKYYKIAAERGHAASQCNLGLCYDNGKGVEQDYEKAVEWFKKSAEQGNNTAQNNLGFCYENGAGVKQDYEKAVEWYQKAAEQENGIAQYNLACCYRDGIGVEQNWSKAVEWFKKSAEQGYAAAQNNLAYCYQDGRGVTQSYEKAVEWYKKAAEQGYMNAQNNLAYCYECGKGVIQNFQEAVRLYQLSARQGNEVAQNNLKHLGETW